MEKDYEDIDRIDELSDNELRALIRDTFDQQVAFDPSDVGISVRSGAVILSGRVGTEQEFRVAERTVSDIAYISVVARTFRREMFASQPGELFQVIIRLRGVGAGIAICSDRCVSLRQSD